MLSLFFITVEVVKFVNQENSLTYFSRSPRWQYLAQMDRGYLPPEFLSWIIDSGSLTARLQQRCKYQFHVSVRSQYYGLPYLSERQALGLSKKAYCLIREVLLYCDEVAVVFARSVLPKSTLTGAEKKLAHMGSDSLGATLFANPSMRREQMQVACISPGQYFYEQATMTLEARPDKIWGRRSVFYLYQKKLLVSEIFLPTIRQFEKYDKS